jgi:transcriptional regulator with XRE-family HTH domain
LEYALYDMDSIPKSLGTTIKDRRLKLGMSQAQVANLTGKTQSQIARLEQGLGDPRISSVVQVSRSLGTEMVAVPIRLMPAVRQLLAEHETASLSPRPARLVGNDPEDLDSEDMEEDGDGL